MYQGKRLVYLLLPPPPALAARHIYFFCKFDIQIMELNCADALKTLLDFKKKMPKKPFLSVNDLRGH